MGLLLPAPFVPFRRTACGCRGLHMPETMSGATCLARPCALHAAGMASIYEHSVTAKDGSLIDLKDYEGKVLLIVNTASKCGFTPQYAGLQKLHDAYGERGLQVMAFPCNQFGRQEPGDDGQIQQFCEINYGVSFPVFAKLEVNGGGAHPLFRQLKKEAKGLLGTESIKWNFTKFLVDRSGRVLGRFGPSTRPAALRSKIEAAL